MSRPVRIVYITQDTALVRGISGADLRSLGVAPMWCAPINTWAVPIDGVARVIEWARGGARRYESVHAELDR